MQARHHTLHSWLATLWNNKTWHYTPLTGDASFRTYGRVTLPEDAISYIIMNAPPAQESITGFVRIAQSLQDHGIHVPRIIHQHTAEGFLVLEDFGDRHLLEALQTEAADPLYQHAFGIIHRLHTWQPHTLALPPFHRTHILEELALFHDWYLTRLLGLSLTIQETHMLQALFDTITTQVCSHPQAPIHRDFHARNLMCIQSSQDASPQLGVLDFQDAMIGSVAYDLVSLLKDCYIAWPQEQVTQWVAAFHEDAGFPKSYACATFQKDVDWCGIQRHLKVLGIFSRLYLRDGKSAYLGDIPRTRHHLLQILPLYPELKDLMHFLSHDKLPEPGCILSGTAS